MTENDLYTIASFWSKVEIPDDDDRACWTWRAATKKGYGRFYPPTGGEVSAHRFAWAYVNGSIPEGAMILHSCDNPPCVNPHHLRPGTAKDNIDDCWSRDRGVRLTGVRNGKAKLSDEQVAAIRQDTRKGSIIANEYGVSQALVSMIRTGGRRTA